MENVMDKDADFYFSQVDPRAHPRAATKSKKAVWPYRDLEWQGCKRGRNNLKIRPELFLLFSSGFQAHYHVPNYFQSKLQNAKRFNITYAKTTANGQYVDALMDS